MAGPPASVAVTVQPLARTHFFEVTGFTGVSPVAQPLPNGRVLIVGAWAEWRPDGPDMNATIYDSDGIAELSACVGDGIEQVVATADGAVWIGYHDMGIFGNNGWGEYGSPADAIHLEAAENDGSVQAGPRYASVYQIHKTRCIFCGYCEEACPVSAIFMGKDYELAVYSKDDFIWDKADLLVPAATTPVAAAK